MLLVLLCDSDLEQAYCGIVQDSGWPAEDC